MIDKKLIHTRRDFLRIAAHAVAISSTSVLFGMGANNIFASGQSDTSTDWREIESLGEKPGARENHSMVYDSIRERLLVFGGRGDTGFLNDLWAFSLEDRVWENLTTSVEPIPPARRTPAAVYDPDEERLIIYSGQGAGLFNDTWAFDLRDHLWTELVLPGERPARRYGTFFAHDSRRNSALTFAGFTSEAGRFDDTWTFSLEDDQWSELPIEGAKPGRRCLHMGAYDSDLDRLMIYGGQRSGPLDDLWSLDPTSNTWREISPATRPAARMFSAFVYDQDQRLMILHGGRGSEIYGDVWAFDSEEEIWIEWTTFSTSPANRHSHAAAWVPGRGTFIHGGNAGNGMLDDMWLLSFV